MGRMRRWQNKLFGLTGALSATQTETDDDRGKVGVPGLCGAIVSIWHQCVIRGVTAFGAPATHGRFGHQESRGEEGVEEKGIGEKGGGKGGQVAEGSWSLFSLRVPRPETRHRLSSFVPSCWRQTGVPLHSLSKIRSRTPGQPRAQKYNINKNEKIESPSSRLALSGKGRQRGDE